jgi:hypothetical protein
VAIDQRVLGLLCVSQSPGDPLDQLSGEVIAAGRSGSTQPKSSAMWRIVGRAPTGEDQGSESERWWCSNVR